jgi:hypothetical protein
MRELRELGGTVDFRNFRNFRRAGTGLRRLADTQVFKRFLENGAMMGGLGSGRCGGWGREGGMLPVARCQ